MDSFKLTFDNSDYYNRCVRARTYNEHMNPNYQLEHTKPIFKLLKLLTVHNLYNYHVTLETFNIIKFRKPYTLFEKIQVSNHNILSLIQPRIRLDIRENNFLCKSASIWNAVMPFIFKKVPLDSRGLEIPGSIPGSDITISITCVKNKLKRIILYIQALGYNLEWDPRNYDIKTYNGPLWTWGI